MADFGKYNVLCRTVPSYPICNLFVKQLLDTNSISSGSLRTAGVGVNPQCAIPRLVDGNLGNIANIIACGLSVFAIGALIVSVQRRQAAVGRIEFRAFLSLYFLTLVFQLLTTGSIFRQGSTHLVVLTAIHLGIVAALFWTLLANGFISLQVVEDGTMASLVPFYFFTLAFFAATTYISLDTAFTWTTVFGPSSPPLDLKSITLFSLTSLWPLAAALLYAIILFHVVGNVLRERKPLMYFVGAAVLFVLSQLDYFLLSKIICKGSNAKVDGSFIATLFETGAVIALFFGWRSITEDTWDDTYHYPI